MRRNFYHLFLLILLACSSALITAPIASVNAASDPRYTVTTTRDLLGTQCGANATYPGQCSLRQALTKAKADGGNVTVSFAIPFTEQSGPGDGNTMPGYDNATNTWTLTLPSGALPIIDKKIDIDGGSQATTAGSDNSGPLIFIDGTGVTNRGGLTLSSIDGARISRLGIINFQGTAQAGDDNGVGIELLNSSNVTIIGCSIGVNQAGNAAAPNDQAGLRIAGGTNNTVGGNNSLNSEFNVISGNSTDGILIRGSNNNKIIGNRIGTNRTGGAAIANLGNGIQVSLGSTGNIIGPAADFTENDATRRNTIAGNGSYGIYLNEASNNEIHGNWIGINYPSSTKIPNGSGGIYIFSTVSEGSNGNKIGGTTNSARNIISGNNGAGILISGPESNSTIIKNNYIGLGIQVSAASGNSGAGIEISGGGDGTIIGSDLAAEANVISGNTLDGIRISGVSSNIADGTIVKNNVIGLFTNETQKKANSGAGILIDSYAANTIIGGDGALQKNRISGNTGAGIIITGTQVLTTTVLGNFVGLKRVSSGGAYTAVEPNGGDGILVGSNAMLAAQNAAPLGVHFTTIGGEAATSRNTIAGNSGDGIRITGTGVMTATIRNNIIGTLLNAQGQIVAATRNFGNGVRAEGSARNIAVRNNTIFGNGANGVLVTENAQRVSVLDTSFTANSGKAIALDPATNDAGNPANPNHDINPPFQLRLNQERQVTGRVLVDPTQAASCITCILQFFAADPRLLDGEGRNQLVTTEIKADANGYFTATLSLLPAQLLVSATDIGGNTSEFATFTVTPSLKITNYGPSAKTASPTETISYTFRVTNTGTLDLTDLKVVAGSDKRWTITPAPTALSLAAGASAPLILTLTLPVGTDARVIAGTIDTSYITVTSTLTPTATASAQARTTVLSSFVLDVTPKAISGEGVTLDPDQPDVREYVHTLTNTGNLAGTVSITATTDLFSTSSPEDWKTTVDVASVTLSPGQRQSVTVRVQLPYGGAAGTVAKTTLAVTQTDPLPTKTLFFTDTTTIVASRRATITPPRVGDGAAAQVTTFEHTVTNFSNTATKFKIAGVSNRGSAVSFRSKTPGVQLGDDGSFTVGTSETNNIFTFYVDILVDPKALRGDTDVVTITLSDEADVVVGGVQDVINVTKSAVVPRLYLPLVFK